MARTSPPQTVDGRCNDSLQIARGPIAVQRNGVIVGATLATILNEWCETRDRRNLCRALLHVLTFLEDH